MRPGKCVYMCIAIVLLVTIQTDGVISEPTKQHEDGKIPDTQKMSETVAENSKSGSKSPLTFDCLKEDIECNKDKYGHEAIIQLHRLLDDDHNGNVDQSESDEFLRDELQYTDGFERHSLFHNDDKLISVDDLWRAWKYCEVYNWTVDDVVDWLQNEVDLPQYSTVFRDNSVSGSFLPRLASSNTFMTSVLGIKNPVHKQKVSLKAMDTVLFGAPPKRHSYIKDLVLVVSVIFAVGGCWFAYLHHRYSQDQVRKMMIDLESLQKAKEALMDVQRKLQDAEKRQLSSVPRPFPDFKEGTAVPSADLSWDETSREGTRLIREELVATRLALLQAETQLENSWAPSGELQAWLQLTHELEQLHYSAKRQAAERQFQAAKEVCEKIKRRNKAFFGSLRMAHSNSLDEIDQRILDARMALEDVKQDLQERLQRWHTIERLCGFPVISNPGLTILHHMLYGTKEGTGNGSRLPVGPVSVDEADEDMPPADDALKIDMDNLGPLPYALYPDSVCIEKERQTSGNKRGTLRLQPRLSYPASVQTLSNKPAVRQRGMMGSTGSLSHLSRNAVNVSAAFSISHPHPVHCSSHDMDCPGPTSNPVTFHLGDQLHDRSATLVYKAQQSLAGTSTHIRNKSFTPSITSSVKSTSITTHPNQSIYHGQLGLSSGNTIVHSSSAMYTMNHSHHRSDDNLSQATIDSLPQSLSSVGVGDRLCVNSGLDLVSHTPGVQSDNSNVESYRLEKKTSKRKKVMNMFRKIPKQKPA